MLDRSVAAEVISSGAAITYDMSVHLLASPWLSLARRSSTRQNSRILGGFTTMNDYLLARHCLFADRRDRAPARLAVMDGAVGCCC